MLTCPMCKKTIPAQQRECLNCRTDVSLLVSYVDDLQEGLRQADALTRQGDLGKAVWAYLAVLEVDPDNAQARRQVGRVATAVRQFDETSYRRWKKLMHREGRFRRWLASTEGGGGDGGWWGGVFWFLIVLAALVLGFFLGRTQPGSPPPADPPPAQVT
jgi:hypothetical protein